MTCFADLLTSRYLPLQLMTLKPLTYKMNNLEIDEETLAFIKQLDNWDLVMLLSEIHDHGWEMAERMLKDIKQHYATRNNKFYE